jgi:hypothetical protein
MIGKEKIAKHRPHCHWAAVICAICGSFLLFGFFGFKRFCHPIYVISKRLTPKGECGIEEFENRLSRAELDLNFAIENDADQDIERHQSAVSVFNLKLVAKRATLSKLVGQLPAAISSASNEFGTLLLSERDRRVAVLTERIAEVLGTDARRMADGHYLDDIFDESPTIKDIDVLRFSCNLIGASDEAVISTARTLLSSFDEILKAGREQI